MSEKITMTPVEKALAIAHFTGALKFDLEKGFPLKASKERVRLGKTSLTPSPFFVSEEVIGTSPTAKALAVNAIKERIHEKKITADLIVSVSAGAKEIARALANSFGIPFVELPETKDRWNPQTTDASQLALYQGKVCLLIGDVITTGDTKERFVAFLRKAGVVVNDLVVILYRQQVKWETLQQASYNIHVILYIRQVLSLGLEEDLITQAEYDACIKYLDENPLDDV
ncbi:phosphoribosyltransferase [Patescibacteria group bacterium]|nr:phosphoribosyltransferase [Patescibacteria group bacterium]